jgi:hypothetical protein
MVEASEHGLRRGDDPYRPHPVIPASSPVTKVGGWKVHVAAFGLNVKKAPYEQSFPSCD